VHYAPARDKGSGAAEGVALMFRRDAKSHPPRMLTLDPSDRFEGKNQRVVLAATLEHPEGPVDVLCTHLSLSRVARTRTAKELIDFAHELRGQTKSVAAILLGDLNAEAGEPAVAEIEREWMDAWRTTRGDHRGGTWPALLPFRRLDYVFVQGLANVETCRRIPYSGSDHLGLFARVHLQQRYPVSGPS
jgi:endonuclease/exonuclease/phosphatase family metal-dependent hydrolase